MSNSNSYRGNPLLIAKGTKIQWTPHRIEEFIKCSEDPVYFTENYIKIVHVDRGLIPFKLYPHQKEAMIAMKNERLVGLSWSRQSGKSQVVAAFMLWYIIFHDNKEVGILANKEDTSKEILARIQLAYLHLPIWLKHGVEEYNKKSMILENGSKISAHACSSDNVRGRSLAVAYIDEVGFVEGYDKFFTSVYPTISSGKTTKIIQSSTPNGLNHWYQTVQLGKQGKNGYKIIEVPWHKVPGRTKKWAAETLAALNGDQEKFSQEYECSFLGSSGTLIAGWKLKELVAEIPIYQHDGLLQYEKPRKENKYALVADVSRGRMLDYSAFSVIDITKMPYKQVCTFRNNLITPTDYASVIFQIATKYNDALLLIESNDIGEQVCEIIYNEYEYINLVQTENHGRLGKKISEGFGGTKQMDKGVRTTITVKNIGCSILKLLIEQNQLIINNQDTIYELSTFSKKNKSYEAEEGKHDDMVMGLVLFAWMTEQGFFKEYTDISTLIKLREKTDEQIMNDLAPFGVIIDGFYEEQTPIDGAVDPTSSLLDPSYYQRDIEDYYGGF